VLSADRCWLLLTEEEQQEFAEAELDRSTLIYIERECQPIEAKTAPTAQRLFVDNYAINMYGHLESATKAAIKGSIFT